MFTYKYIHTRIHAGCSACCLHIPLSIPLSLTILLKFPCPITEKVRGGWPGEGGRRGKQEWSERHEKSGSGPMRGSAYLKIMLSNILICD